MAHRNSSRDPPDFSSRDLDRRRLTEPRPSFAPRAGSERAPDGVPDPQNAQRPKDKTPIGFHRFAHSFPDYGSVKGAVKMPPPSKFRFSLRGMAPQTHVDTLDSNLGCLPSAHQITTFRAPGRSPAPKRPKIHEAHRRGPDEDIVDKEQDAASREERRGSQSSFAHSVSPGVSEYQTVEGSTARPGRSNRRTRRFQGNHPPATTNHERRVGTHREPENIESFDELTPARKPDARQQRTARLVSTAGARSNAVISDSADQFILGKLNRPGQHPHSLHKGKKRSSHEITDDPDELGGEANGGGASKGGARLPSEDLPKRDPPSLSRRGDMKPTKWVSKPGTSIIDVDIGAQVAVCKWVPKPDTGTIGVDVGVQAAVCLPNLRYEAGNGQDPCFLRPTDDCELRAFAEDGRSAEPFDWLKITRKARTLTFHPESNYIKIHQAADQTSSTTIGGLMVLKFRNSGGACWVADWAGENLDVQVVREKDSQKLLQTWDRQIQEVRQAGNQASTRRRSDGSPARQQPDIKVSSTTKDTVPGSASSSSRTPIRHQMQVSAQQQTPLPIGSVSELATSGSRSFRIRRNAQQAQNPETPPATVISRWSEEHPDWAKNWKTPLMFERTTVDKEDVPRLDEGECLNDNLIGYGLRYLFNKFSKRHDDLHKRVYLHNSFFYEKLKAGRGTINYDGVKSWTAKVDLLSYDYIVVPVNEHYHWWVAIICNPGTLDPDSTEPQGTTDDPSNPMGEKADGVSLDVEMTDVAEKQSLGLTCTAVDEPSLVKSDIVDLVSDDKNVSVDLDSGSRAKQSKKLKPGARTYNFEDPRIITLDSLGSSHSPAIAHLKKYLLAEFEHKRNKIIKDIPQNLGMKATNIPEQNNLCDCGVYLLGYIQEFVKNPDLFVQTLLRRERPDWDFNPSELRGLWRDTITFEHKMYQEHQLKTEQRRREALAAKRTPKGSAEPSRQPSRAPSEVHSAPNGKCAVGVAPSEQPTPVDAAGTPTNPAAREVDSPSSKQAPHDLRSNSAEQPRPTTPAPARSPQQQSLDADVVVLPPKDDDAVLPSIEAPDVEEVPAPPRRSQDEPVFIARLPSSSSSTRGADDDGDTIMEVAPSSFYASHNKASGSGQNRSGLSSPAGGRGKRAARTRPKHTSSHFVVDGTPEFDSVVEKAEMVRNPEPIDLT